MQSFYRQTVLYGFLKVQLSYNKTRLYCYLSEALFSSVFVLKNDCVQCGELETQEMFAGSSILVYEGLPKIAKGEQLSFSL